jgi:hypothetical protein
MSAFDHFSKAPLNENESADLPALTGTSPDMYAFLILLVVCGTD